MGREYGAYGRAVSLAAAAALLGGSPAFAQDKAAEIDRIFAWAAPGAPGCTVSVAHKGKTVASRAYGAADLERAAPLTPASVFDAGSVQKQFVAAAALLLVEEGKLSLDDDVRKHIPELPDYGHRMTLDHLLTHTSGLRDWDGILPLSAREDDALTVILRQRSLNFVPGEEWAYSNSGFVLLKEIVARTSGMKFGAFAGKRLFEPLGMKATHYRHDLREIVPNRALGYDKDGGVWRLATQLDNDRGGGGALLTTADDLVLWIEAVAAGRLGPLLTAKLQEPATLSNGRKLGYARGLFLEPRPGGTTLWHSGSTGGYKSFLVRDPELRIATAILCNSGDGTDRMAFARKIFDLYAPRAEAPAAARPAAAPLPAVSVPDLASRAGLFFAEGSGTPLRLAADEGRFRIAGGPALVPLDGTRFRTARPNLNFMSQAELELRFLAPDSLELKTAEGKVTRYRRAAPFAPTQADMLAFAGRYESREINSVYRVTPGEGGLTIALEHAPGKSALFKPVDRDAFQLSQMIVRFRRDKAGRVVALDYSNPVLRKVEFRRLADERASSAAGRD